MANLAVPTPRVAMVASIAVLVVARETLLLILSAQPVPVAALFEEDAYYALAVARHPARGIPAVPGAERPGCPGLPDLLRALARHRVPNVANGVRARTRPMRGHRSQPQSDTPRNECGAAPCSMIKRW